MSWNAFRYLSEFTLSLLARGGENPPFSTFEFLELAKFFAGAAEPHMNLGDGLVDFFSQFFGVQALFAGSVEEVDDLLLHETFGRTWFLGAFGNSPALLARFGAQDARGGENLAGGQRGDVFFDLGNLGQQYFFFLGQGKKCRQGLRIDVCYFHWDIKK